MGNPDGVARPKARRLRRAFSFAQAVPDEPDPPRKNYGFKDRDFKRDNALKSTEPPPPTAKELAIMSGPVANHGKAAVGSAKVEDPNDVYAVLQENRTVEKNTASARSRSARSSPAASATTGCCSSGAISPSLARSP